ncbi:MAG: alpha/beta fold hydrolase [Bacillota bacterium]|jgi:medium-chain acyl-[acyl-carrier-protein] hydrolase
MALNNNWFPFGTAQDHPTAKRVFCFHYAGGSSAVFKHWARGGLPVAFIPVELPGRGTRISEPCPDEVASLLAELIPSLTAAIADRPFCLFGHSMGAVLAFEVAYLLRNQYGLQADKLIVAGRQAPHYPDPFEFKTYMGDEALIRELRRLGGTADQILESSEILQFLLPMIRSDYKLHESYIYRGQKLDIPIIAHTGRHDADAGAAVMKHWEEVTDGPFELHEFDGNHFFVQNLGEKYLRELIGVITRDEYPLFSDLKFTIR